MTYRKTDNAYLVIYKIKFANRFVKIVLYINNLFQIKTNYNDGLECFQYKNMDWRNKLIGEIRIMVSCFCKIVTTVYVILCYYLFI